MKVLLLGEYSGVHTNLAKGLKKLGHEVYIISDGDGYKRIGSPDMFVTDKVMKSNFRIFSIILSSYYNFLDFLGLKGVFSAISYINRVRKLSDFDVVQLINTRPFSSFSSIGNFILLYIIFKRNNKIFLCALGDDYTWVKSCLNEEPPYSMFNRLNIRNIKHYFWPLKYVYGIGYKKLDNYVINRVEKIIPGLYDYYFAYRNAGCKKLSEIIPLPIDFDENIKPIQFDSYPVKIFHGWQFGRDLRKGNDYFDLAVKDIIRKHPNKVSYEIISGLPYAEYIKKFNTAHIVLDQCMSLDKGMNAVIGMREGKAVLSGLHSMTKDYYGMSNEKALPLIDVTPVVEEIKLELEKLILNPSKLNDISKNALSFIKTYHDTDIIVQKYIDVWTESH